MNWERFGHMTLPLSYWDTMSLKFAQRLVKTTWNERIDWNCAPKPWIWERGEQLRTMYQDLQAIIDEHGSKLTLEEALELGPNR